MDGQDGHSWADWSVRIAASVVMTRDGGWPPMVPPLRRGDVDSRFRGNDGGVAGMTGWGRQVQR